MSANAPSVCTAWPIIANAMAAKIRFFNLMDIPLLLFNGEE
jgi:hypothetical protein